ncbi:MAG TPA: undecaprenyl/decaprenyl-phosphate alpha-N-acetylglucosaminyl 1-phosphate transferase [Flavobacteriales bacterium]|nr:undecaprenyl/decaprenyl-phosphate alpha-N-acetylglucosaminyl 1-phosphate transferase [Flavobacteriales bacterium]
MTNLYLGYLVFFIVATLFSFLINRLFLKFSKNLGTRSKREIIRWETKHKPALGGISFYILFLLSIISYAYVFNQSGTIFNKQYIGFTLAVSLAFLMGLADDAYDTIPLLKLSTQLFCGFILIYSGIYINIFDDQLLNYGLTLFWIVSIMNAMNLLDNMDAISSIVSVFVILTGMLIIYLEDDITNAYFLLLTGVMAGVLGFLYFNWYPSKVYMGDTGSQFLGLFLAIIGIIYFWNLPSPSLPADRTQLLDTPSFLLKSSKNVLIAVLAFIVPIVDTSTVFINRIAKGTSPFIGGKDHTSHHLSYLGFNEKKIALLYMIICIVSLIMTYYILQYIDRWSILHLVCFSLYILVVFLTLFLTTKISSPKSANSSNILKTK